MSTLRTLRPGMETFERWYRPPGVDPRKHPADADGLLHTVKGNRFWMFEFKPYESSVTQGQHILLEGFGMLPGCQATLIFDPFAETLSRDAYGDDQILDTVHYRRGVRTPYRTTVRELNIGIARWFNGEDRKW